MKKTYSLELAYEGSAFKGWHMQTKFPSVQTTLISVLSELYGEKIFLWGAGRTDSGAHALRYTAHFRTRTDHIPQERLQSILNGALPPTIRILKVSEEDIRFHATFTCTARTYMYLVYTGKILPPLYYNKMYHDSVPLDISRLKRAMRLFVGIHDFAHFCYGYTQEERARKTTERHVDSFRVKQYGEVLVFFIKGEGFLRGMIRMILGVCLSAGRGIITEEDISKAFNGTPLDTSVWKPVSAEGLYFKRAHYDRQLHAAALRRSDKKTPL